VEEEEVPNSAEGTSVDLGSYKMEREWLGWRCTGAELGGEKADSLRGGKRCSAFGGWGKRHEQGRWYNWVKSEESSVLGGDADRNQENYTDKEDADV